MQIIQRGISFILRRIFRPVEVVRTKSLSGPTAQSIFYRLLAGVLEYHRVTGMEYFYLEWYRNGETDIISLRRSRTGLLFLEISAVCSPISDIYQFRSYESSVRVRKDAKELEEHICRTQLYLRLGSRWWFEGDAA